MIDKEESPVRYCIFDDEYYTCLQMAETIRMLRPNYQLVGTADDCQGIRQCLELKPDLILSDLCVSDAMCPAILQSLHCQIPIIFDAGYYADEEQLAGLCKVAYLLKPTSPLQWESAFRTFDLRRNVIG